MRKLALLSVVGAFVGASISGCEATPSEPSQTDGSSAPLFTSPVPIPAPADIEEVAEDEWTCSAYGYAADRVRVRWKAGDAHAVCLFKGLPRIQNVVKLSGFPCNWWTEDGYNYSYRSEYMRTPGGTARLRCVL